MHASVGSLVSFLPWFMSVFGRVQNEQWRLRGGMNASAGRLEVFHRDEWGTVCDDGFGELEATVACRTLGLPTKFAKREDIGWYGTGYGNIWIDDLNCRGNETELSRCFHRPWERHNCDHYEDVAISCYENDGPAAHYRLAGLAVNDTGRVEVFYDGVWGTVCNDRFTQRAAAVVCRSLGFPATHARIIPISDVGIGNLTRIWLDEVVCTGVEPELARCSHDLWGRHNCIHSKDIAITCSATWEPPFPESSIRYRLTGGPDRYTGRLDVYYGGRWGSVCDHHFSGAAARVVCRSLGYSSTYARAIPNSEVREGIIATIWLDEVTCQGDEMKLSNCGHDPWGKNDCGHGEDVAMTCSQSYGTTTTSSPSGLTRLASTDDPISNYGTVQVFHAGEWGTVCDDGFGQEEAQVVCRSLQLPTSIAIQPIRENQDSTISGQIWLSALVCTGYERNIFDCDHGYPMGYPSCSHSEDVSVLCGNDYESTVRLVGESAPKSGRVEVGYHGKWGTVCSEGFDSWAARVVCGQLGYSTENARVVSRLYGGGSGDIWIRGIDCTGGESNLFQCHQRSGSCDHNLDVHIFCGSDESSRVGGMVGAIVGIVVGCVIVIFCVTFLVVKCRKRGNTTQRSANNRAINTGSNAPVVYSVEWNGNRDGQINMAFGETPYQVAPLSIPSAPPPAYTELDTAEIPPKYEDLFPSEDSTGTDII